MKRFRFPLNGLARLREQQVHQQERRLGTALARLKSAEAIRDRIIAQLELKVQSTPMDAEWSVADRIALDEEQEQLRRALAQAALQVREENRNVLEERERLHAVEKDREILDRLREQKQEEYLRDLMRHEQQEMDDHIIQTRGEDENA